MNNLRKYNITLSYQVRFCSKTVKPTKFLVVVTLKPAVDLQQRLLDSDSEDPVVHEIF